MTRARVRACIVESLYYLWLVTAFTLIFNGGVWLLVGLLVLAGAAAYNQNRCERARRANPGAKCTASWRQFFAEMGVWLVTMLDGSWLLAHHRIGAVACGAVMVAGGVANIWFGHDCYADCETGSETGSNAGPSQP